MYMPRAINPKAKSTKLTLPNITPRTKTIIPRAIKTEFPIPIIRCMKITHFYKQKAGGTRIPPAIWCSQLSYKIDIQLCYKTDPNICVCNRIFVMRRLCSARNGLPPSMTPIPNINILG